MILSWYFTDFWSVSWHFADGCHISSHSMFSRFSGYPEEWRPFRNMAYTTQLGKLTGKRKAETERV